MIPAVSIIIPVYNAGEYLPECLDSIIKQIFPDFELLIIDDGSTDNSIDIIKSFPDRRIRLIMNKHDFIGSLNLGLNEAKGKYIARMDADDIMLSHRLQTQYDFMETNPDIDICGSYAESFGELKDIIQRPVKQTDIVSSMLLSNPIIHPSVMIRRSILRQSGCLYQYGYACAEDYKLWTDLALKGFKFANIPEPLLLYRISPQQVTQVFQNDMVVSSLKIGLEYAEAVMEQLVEKEERYGNLFNALIELFNDELISPKTFLQAIYPVCREHIIRYAL